MDCRTVRRGRGIMPARVGRHAAAALAAVLMWTTMSGCAPADAVGSAAAEPQAIPAPARPGTVPRGTPAAEHDGPRRVRQVIDGDTITVSGVGTVRLIGVDAPEKTGGYRQSEPFGDEATRFMKALVEGRMVTLEYDGDRKDQYNRTLAYVLLEDGRCANEEIIRAGWAETYRRFEYWRKPDFQRAEREARAARRGMWKARSR